MKKPTDAELDILAILWREGPVSVRDVHRELSETRDVVYTTVLKTMQVMTDKGLVRRDTSQKSHLYEAVVSQEMVRENMVDKLLNTVFDGSPLKLVMHALGHGDTSKEDLDRIKQLIQNIEQENKQHD